MDIFKAIAESISKLDLYPESQPFDSGNLDVGDGHTLYYERHGNPKGKPVVYLHGGPGGGCGFGEYRWFNPDHFNVLMFDQRGSGKSTPYASTHANDIPHLVKDIETLRKHCDVKSWSVCGGSWGSALAMFYAAKHGKHVDRLLLRGVFFADQQGTQHLVETPHLTADKETSFYKDYIDFIPEEERRRNSLLQAYHTRIMSDDLPLATEAARRFYVWDTFIATHQPRQDWIDEANADPQTTLALSRLWFHFARDHFKDGNKKTLLQAMSQTRIPVNIIHGHDDKICPVENAKELHSICPVSTLKTPVDCGHSQAEPPLLEAFINITNCWMKDDQGTRRQPKPVKLAP